MKKKAARRKPSKQKNPTAKNHELHHLLPDRASREQFERMVDGRLLEKSSLEGVPLPADLDLAVGYFAHYDVRTLDQRLKNPPISQVAEDSEDWQEAFDPLACSDAQLEEVESCVRRAIRKGFYLALLRYRDDLKHVPEVAVLIAKEEARKETARTNGRVRAERAAPLRRKIEKLFRQLRKTEPKRGRESLYRQIAKEVGRSERHVQRIVNDADID